MTIKELNATFGNLDKATLRLNEGLNIVQAPNEGGKSTWSAFVRAMLYGIPTGQRDKAGFLAEKNRYQPWNGAPAQGSMTLEWEGREILLRRKAKGASPFGTFEAVDAKTGEPIPQLTADTAGPLLVGAEREVFERSAFVGQSALTVDGSPALEKRIAGLLSSGLEEVSFSQVERQLKDWQNRRKHNKTGLIPQLESEVETLTLLLARLNRARLQRQEGLRDLEQLRRDKTALEGDKAAYKALQEEQKFLQYKTAYEEYQSAKAQYDQAAAGFQNLPDQGKILEGQEALSYIQTLSSTLKIRAGELARVREQAPPPAEGGSLSAGMGVLCTLVGLGVAVGAYLLAVYLNKPIYNAGMIGFFAAAVGVASGAILVLLLKAKGAKGAQAKTDSLWEGQLAALEREIQAMETELAEKRQRLAAFVHTFSPTAEGDAAMAAALSRALAGEDRLAPLTVRLDGAKKAVELARAALGPDPKPPAAPTVPPRLPYQEVVARLMALNEELSRRERMVATAEGELRSLGDPDATEARLDAAKEALARRQEEYEALDVALEALAAANQTMQARFSPDLNRRAGELMSALTGGKYDGLTLTRDFQAAAQEAGEILPRSVLSLSQGTADQLYLAVRLAVCDLTLPRENPPVLVLDDALANFDDRRLGLALDHLLERSRTQQILLFTCHSRERAYLAGKPGVHVVEF